MKNIFLNSLNVSLFAANTFSLNNKGISVVIPNFNGINLLPEILPPLYLELKKTNLPFEVIVSDDCSTDSSVSFIKKNFPEIILLESEINQGFSKTINKGIFIAQYGYLFLLNSDVKLTENYFSNQFKYFEKQDTFGVMGRIIGWDDDKIQDGGKFPSFHGVKIKTNVNYFPVLPNENDQLYSMYLSGANAFVDRNKIIALNGFDEVFSPYYVEDYELSLRAWRMGWKCYYDHISVCRHKTSTTIKTKSKKYFIKSIYYRNKIFLHFIHLSELKLFFWYFQLFFETLFSIFTGKFYFLKSLQLFFRDYKKAKSSKMKFKNILNKQKISFSVEQVAKIVLNNISNISFNSFKS